jgi:hypothetical protein
MRYTAYGITVAVPFPCPELTPAAPDGVADVVVRAGAVPRELAGAVLRDECWDSASGVFLVRGGRRAGRFLVTPHRITLERNPEGEDARLARCYVDDVLPALLRLRGCLVLHAGAVLTPHGVVVVAGESGAGKSTTLAALLDRDAALLADDVVALRLAPGGHVEVLPGPAELSLTAAALTGLGLGLAVAAPGKRAKATLATHRRMAAGPEPLRAICRLERDGDAEPALHPLTGAGKLGALQSCVLGPMLAEEHTSAFPLSQALLRTAGMYRLTRPSDGWTVDRVAELVLAAGER